MQRTTITIRGTRPMLQNRMPPDQLELLRDKTKKPGKTPSRPPAEEEAAAKVYMANGAPCLPIENLMSCLIQAGKFIRLDGKRQLSTSETTILPGILSIEDEVIPLLKHDAAIAPSEWGPAQWKYDMRQGRNPNSGDAVCIVRPRFDRWAATFTAQMDVVALPEDTFRQLFDFAGLRVGLGDFRPERKGIFGQFVVSLWQAKASVAA